MTDDRRREVGSSDAPVEDEIHESFDAIVEEGAERLQRTTRVVLTTGFAGGLEIGLGVMGYLAVLHETDSHLLAGLAFSIGLIALYLAHSELFTENFLVPITALIAREGTVGQLLRLWVGTLLANLAGGWVVMWLVVQAFPQWHGELVEAGRHYVEAPFGLQTAVLAVLGGSTITLVTRMQQGTDSDPAKIVAAVVGGFLLSGLQLFHSILDSLLVFGAIQAGAELSYGQWAAWSGWTLLFNVLGGLVLVTALRLVRSADLLRSRRRDAPSDPARSARERDDG
ncbi:formate transporter [Curtobacterium citreum]|uniref:Formate/nitrite transporter family protein n=1 Tax=Curtobacterium citreum TaxID=2036 RepID=A0ABT2HD04_9MICO|nr:formate/nitrite transporter family protein [Curtobacterium citreum]MCS6521077.1 formate/nitrite transporter family protein [Curtobacterium citreum]TQJ27931.1 formate/nitrite transporter FocA (FNT family) [Curtobacterium citreum]GGL70968.1 formate transporter [Curtobacterium citreum]